MAVIKTGNTTQLVEKLYSQIADAVVVTNEVQNAVQGAVNQISNLDQALPVAGITNKLTDTAKNVTLNQTLKNAVTGEDETTNGTNKVSLTGTGLDSKLASGNVTGLVVSSNTTATEKGPVFLGTETYVENLSAKVSVDLTKPGNLTVGNFTSSESQNSSESGYKINAGQAVQGATTAETLSESTAFVGQATYVDGNLSSSTIKSVTNKVNDKLTSDGSVNDQAISASHSESFTLTSKQGLTLDATPGNSGLKGSIDSLTFNEKNSYTDDSFQSTNLGNAVDVISDSVTLGLVVNQAQAAVDKAYIAKTTAESDLDTANSAKTAADLVVGNATADKASAQLALDTANSAKTAADLAVTEATTAKTS
ncbi:hypothetical protein CYD26_24305, partial [Pseudomonas sp. FFUP_PS_473]|uniref:hypothetical protein n=1 Tax=Pseudomonas sp. FFUP_PS_473 TaxID=2060418 RepID=UPI000CB908A0